MATRNGKTGRAKAKERSEAVALMSKAEQALSLLESLTPQLVAAQSNDGYRTSFVAPPHDALVSPGHDLNKADGQAVDRRSLLDRALDDLHTSIAMAQQEFAALADRLKPISCQVPTEKKAGGEASGRGPESPVVAHLRMATEQIHALRLRMAEAAADLQS